MCAGLLYVTSFVLCLVALAWLLTRNNRED
jgi:hypothetical protein